MSRRSIGRPLTAENRRRMVSTLASIAVTTSLLLVPTLNAAAPADAAPAQGSQVQPAKVTRLDSAKGAAQFKTAQDAWAHQKAASAALIAADATAAKDAKSRKTGSGSTSTLSPQATTAGTTSSGDGSGTYTATPLSPSSTWTAGGSSGSFDWSYPFTIPAPAAG